MIHQTRHSHSTADLSVLFILSSWPTLSVNLHSRGFRELSMEERHCASSAPGTGVRDIMGSFSVVHLVNTRVESVLDVSPEMVDIRCEMSALKDLY